MGVFRINPALPITAYTTFGLSFRRRKATCAEVECFAYTNGWKTIVPDAGPQAQYIRAKSERHFLQTRLPGGLVEFNFPSGQRCFGSDQHKITVPVAPVATLRGGDWRGATTPLKRVGVIEWRDRFQENQSALADRIQRG